jgi:hypothetical protein
MVYFGFTNCPDICPAELDKVTAVLNNLRAYLETELDRLFMRFLFQKRNMGISSFLSSSQ